MRAADIIRKKRDGGELSREEIEFIVRGATHGTISDHQTIPDYQLTAWLMAVVWRGMTNAETAALTEAMLRSGGAADFSTLPGTKVDKHSTGGVGDKTSLVVAPVVAAAGACDPRVYVPMISGRGLGHTGGTLDKLESIPGFNVNLSLREFCGVVEKCGCAMIGQTPEIAPADKKLYALRDVTATVESPPLICASILSKKLAEGIGALVLDVKTGDGAFMKKQKDAEHLARLMVTTGTRMGTKVVALITSMEQPLGRKIGNALEVEESVEVLHGKGPADVRELCRELSARMFVVAGRTKTVAQGRALAEEMIASGRARDTFREVIRLQGGDPRIVDDPSLLPRARHATDIKARRAGYVTRMRCEQVGVAAMMLGGGREKTEDAVDPAAGIVLEKKTGDRVKAGETLCTMHYNEEARREGARELLESSFEIGAKAPRPSPLVRKIIGAREVD